MTDDARWSAFRCVGVVVGAAAGCVASLALDATIRAIHAEPGPGACLFGGWLGLAGIALGREAAHWAWRWCS